MQLKDRKTLLLVAFSVSFGFLTAGVTSGWTTPALFNLRFKINETGINIGQDGLTTLPALNPVGFIVGALAMQVIADRFGRRVTILASAIPVALGSVLLAFAQGVWLIYIGYFMKNIGTGLLSSVIGMYNAEIADKDMRATLAFISSFMFKLGALLITSIGPYLSYQTMNIAVVFLPFAYFLACWWIPETPHYLLKNGNEMGARKSLKKIRGNLDDMALDREFDNINMAVKKETSGTESFYKTNVELITKAKYRRALMIAFGLKTAVMFTGGLIMHQYLSWIIKDTGIPYKTEHVLLVYSGISFGVGLMSTLLVDRMGRKPLLISSFLGAAVSHIIIGFFFFSHSVLNVSKATLSTYAFVPLLAIVVVNVMSSMGFNSLIHLIPAEVFPLNVKAVALTNLHVYGAILGAINGKVFGLLYFCNNCIPPYAYTAYWVFAAFGIAGAIFTKFFVIETKGKDLGDIQRELQGSAYDDGSPVEETELQELNKTKL